MSSENKTEHEHMVMEGSSSLGAEPEIQVEASHQHHDELMVHDEEASHPGGPEELSQRQLDEIIEESLGQFGWREFLRAVLVSMAMFFEAQQCFVGIYADNFPGWHCKENSTSCHGDICSMPKASWSWDSPESMTTISDWGMECASSIMAGLPQSSFFAGSVIGTLFLAAAAESSFGRKNMLVLSCFIMSVSSTLIMLSPNIWIYSVMKFFIGLGRSSIGTCVIVLVTENVSAEWRFAAGNVECLCYIMGYMSLPAIAYVTRNHPWKFLYLFTAVPAVFYSFAAYLFIQESPRWLLLRGRVREAVGVLKGVSLPEHYLASFRTTENASIYQIYSSIGELFKKRWALKRMVWTLLLGIGVGTVYFSLALAVGNLGFNLYLTVVISAVVEIPASTATYFVKDFRRKPSIIIFSVLSGICSLLCAVIGDKVPVLNIVLAMISFCGASTTYFIFMMYLVELFPTSVRFITTSTVRLAITCGCMISPFLISAGRKHTIFSYGVFGVVLICSNLTLFGLPETKGIVFRSTLDEEEGS